MNSRGEQRSLRVGLWLGNASLIYGGIGPYAFRILDALVTGHEPGWKLVLLCNADLSEKFNELATKHPEFVEVKVIPSAPQAIRLRLQQARRAGAKIRSLIKTGGHATGHWHYMQRWLDDLQLDLLHFPTQTILHRDLQVPYSLTMYGVEEPLHFRLRVPYLVTMHDVQELHFPENFTPAARAIRAVHYWKALEGARRVIVSFDHVKQDLVRFFGISPEKIHVCPIPFKSISLSEAAPAASLSYARKYTSWSPFLLYPSYTWPHKNHVQLLRALGEVKRSGFETLHLICTGGTNHPCYSEIKAAVKALCLSDSVHFAGTVPEDELCWLYRHTSLVTIPTRYEAGSFPLYEAMVLGAPVICSNVTSLPETICDARFIFDPLDAVELSKLILRMLSDEAFRRSNIANSAQQIGKLRSIDAAPFFYATYRSALDRSAIPSKS